MTSGRPSFGLVAGMGVTLAMVQVIKSFRGRQSWHPTQRDVYGAKPGSRVLVSA